tara:strand:- start:77 stop:736 length:660 start_codon:yes stop_codon:yes gene_type:complete
MKYFIKITTLACLLIIGCSKSKENNMNANETDKVLNKNADESMEENTSSKSAVISTKFGDIVIEFFDELAPKHVESFKAHVNSDYYNGTTFHRVIPGFMIQGGDPLTRSDDRTRHGTGGHAGVYYGIGDESNEETWNLPAEFNSQTHSRGIVSMARSQNPDSGGSQFFICVADAQFLDNQYTAFGRVIDGMEVADQIVNSPRDSRDNPNDKIDMKVALK